MATQSTFIEQVDNAVANQSWADAYFVFGVEAEDLPVMKILEHAQTSRTDQADKRTGEMEAGDIQAWMEIANVRHDIVVAEMIRVGCARAS